jgi:hypothetical protein
MKSMREQESVLIVPALATVADLQVEISGNVTAFAANLQREQSARQFKSSRGRRDSAPRTSYPSHR